MKRASQPSPPTLPDAATRNIADRLAPQALRPYVRLARFDRPIGAWLLLFPCWWGVALATLASGRPLPDPWLLALFLIGAFVMRGAGCTYNDIVDRDYDAGVARTRDRPIPSGQVSVAAAVAFMAGLALTGLLVLLQFNAMTILLAISSLALVAVYPFAKRYTYWPQLVLGLTFKWGALVGWTAVRGTLETPAALLYVGCVLWTIGYDTIYAHQDKEDDLALGLKSTAIRFGRQTVYWLAGFYTAAVCLWAVAGYLAGGRILLFLGLAIVAMQLAWQIATLRTDDPGNCLTRFRSNRLVGWIMFLAIVGDAAF